MTVNSSRFYELTVDLTGSRLGPKWRNVELLLEREPDEVWDAGTIRLQAATYYDVPLEQVGPITTAPTRDDG